MPEIILAKTAGFCFGVDRAVKMCHGLLDEDKKVATLGNIIHNDRVVKELERRGCFSVSNPEDTPDGATLVIRSHGVPKKVYERCQELGVKTADATCPFVATIHKIVAKYSAEGHTVLIAGDRFHPEVEGIAGHCANEPLIFDNIDDLSTLLDGDLCKNPCIMVAQTTFNLVKYNECVALAKKRYTNLLIFDTICCATIARQQEAKSIAESCDVCIVIGGRSSSNTQKLAEVCRKNAVTHQIETAIELKLKMLMGAEKIGVTAGASTPSPLIEEVLTKMSDIIKDEDFNFEQALEESLHLVHRGQRVEGIITSIKPNEVVVDIGTKHTGFIPLDELSDDPAAKPEDVVKVGDKVNLIVTKVQDLEGFVTLSKKRVDSEKGLEDLEKGVEDGTIFDAYISEVVNKGLVAIVKGVRVFIPASQATLRRGEEYEQLARTHQKIKIIEADVKRRRAIGSIRAVLDVENQKKREEFWQTVEIGKHYNGTVKSLTDYGAFVDLGGVDGMVHKSELSWDRMNKPSDVVSVGDVIDVHVKDIDAENKKISLGYRKEEENPWNLVTTYALGSEFQAPVVSVTKFGAFVRILPGVDGLVHISEMSDEHVKVPSDVVKVGDTVKVRLIGVNTEQKRVSLSMRAPKEEVEVAEAAETVVEATTPAEADEVSAQDAE